MNTEMAFNLMEKIFPDIVEIMTDPAITDFKTRTRENTNSNGYDIIGDLFPILMHTHRDNVYSIIAAYAGKTVDEVKEMDFSETKKVWRGVNMEELFTFFVPWARLVLKA